MKKRILGALAIFFPLIGFGFESLAASVIAIENDRTLRPALTSALKEIFRTETGRQALCPFVKTDSTFKLYIGDFPEIRAEIRARCGNKYDNPVLLGIVRAMSSMMPGDPGPSAPVKKYSFIGPAGDMASIASFTNKANHTFFLILRKEMSGPLLIRALAHELAMSYDQLARLGYLIDPTRWDQGLNAAFKQPIYGDPVFESTGGTVAEVSCALRDPGIRYALATERAFKFEDKIAAELNLDTRTYSVSSFRGTVDRFAQLYLEFTGVIHWETMKYEVACGKLAKADKERALQIEKRAQILERIELQNTRTKEKSRLIDLLIEPYVGPFLPDLDGGGPRPRMSGWGGDL